MRKLFLIQASSVSWTGEPDLCMNKLDGKRAIQWTIEKIYQYFQHAEIIVIAPEFDQNGSLNELCKIFDQKLFSIRYSHDSSPLERMIGATADLDEKQYVIRVDGLHFWFDTELTKEMFNYAVEKNLDCVKPPDDFPAQLSSEIFKVGALRSTKFLLNNADSDESKKYHIHPKFFIQRENKYFSAHIYENIPEYSDEFFNDCRNSARQIYTNPRINLTDNRIKAGDSISFHYEYSKRFLKSEDHVLDIASGLGFGSAILSKYAKSFVCADLDELAIIEGENIFSHIPNIKFSKQDVTSMTFESNIFDVVLSMETIEHVDEKKYLEEIHRVLKPGGILIVSTPQNQLGRIPITSEHIKEYSLKELKILISNFFKIESTIGIKAGTIFFEDDPIGSNSIVVARRL